MSTSSRCLRGLARGFLILRSFITHLFLSAIDRHRPEPFPFSHCSPLLHRSQLPMLVRRVPVCTVYCLPGREMREETGPTDDGELARRMAPLFIENGTRNHLTVASNTNRLPSTWYGRDVTRTRASILHGSPLTVAAVSVEHEARRLLHHTELLYAYMVRLCRSSPRSRR